jgi:hypothetical protein
VSQRFHAESDGGGWWVGGTQIRQPKTYYVVDRIGGYRIDCENRKQCGDLARKLEAMYQKLLTNSTGPENDAAQDRFETAVKSLEDMHTEELQKQILEGIT